MNFSRRRFLAASSALSITTLVGLPAIGLAQESTDDEIVVFGTVQSAGSSIYDGGAILRLAKATAMFGSGVATAAAGIYGAIAVAGGSAAVVDPEPATTALLAVLSGAIFLEALAFGGMGTLLAFIGADPPRSNYKVSVCKGAVMPMPQSVRGFPALDAFQKLLQTATTSARQFWDGIELWQGAKLADDGEWMNIHYKSCVDAYRKLYDASQAMPDASQAMFNELRKSPKIKFKVIQAALKPHAGKQLSDLPGFGEMVKKVSQKTPCGGGVNKPALDILMAQKVPGNLQQAIRQNIRGQKRFARMLDKPI